MRRGVGGLATGEAAVGHQQCRPARHAVHNPDAEPLGALLEFLAQEVVAAGKDHLVTNPQRLAKGPARRQWLQLGGNAGVPGELGRVEDCGHHFRGDVERHSSSGQLRLLRSADPAVVEGEVGQRQQKPAVRGGDGVDVELVDVGEVAHRCPLVGGEHPVLQDLGEQSR